MHPTLARPAITATLFGALLIATYLVYTPGFHGPFTLDDGIKIPRTAVATLDWEGLREHVFWSAKLGGLSRGLTNLSFALTQFFSGFDPFTFKYQNTLLHLVNGALVFWLCSLLLGWRNENKHAASLLALAVAAVWLLHPLQVSTVLYAVQRLVLLSSLFVLAALIAYVKGRTLAFRRPVAGSLLAAGGVATFGTLGVLSKENAALLPLYLAAIELFFFRLQSESRAQKRLLYVLLGLVVALPVVLALVYGAGHLSIFLANFQNRNFTLTERLLTEVHAIALYLKLFFLPLPGSMSLFHDNFPIQRQLDIPTIALACSYLGLAVLAVWLRKLQPVIGFGILWFFISHLLESTVLPLEVVFEHRNYLAILGLSLTLIVGLSRILATPKLNRVAPVLMLALTALLAFNTGARAFVWSNGELWLRTQYQHRPDSQRVLSGLLGLELGRGKPEAARRYAHEARRLDPDSPLHLVNELRTYCNTDSFPPEIAENASRKIAQNARIIGLHGALDSLTSRYLAGGCPTLGFGTIHDLVSAYAESDALPSGREHFLALILQGRLLVSEERWPEAEAVYSRALDLSKGRLEAYKNLTTNEFFLPFLESGNIDRLARLLMQVAEPSE